MRKVSLRKKGLYPAMWPEPFNVPIIAFYHGAGRNCLIAEMYMDDVFIAATTPRFPLLAAIWREIWRR